MSSASTQGGTEITLQFAASRNIDAAAQNVQAQIANAQAQLPTGMPAPPSYQKVNPADQPILYMAVYSDTLPASTVNDYADTLMAQRISMISGVAQVQVFGAQKYAVRVQFDPKALATRKIGIDEAMAAIQQANVNLPDRHTLRHSQIFGFCRPPGSLRMPRLTGLSSSPTAMARRCDWTPWPKCSTTFRTTRSRTGTTASHPR